MVVLKNPLVSDKALLNKKPLPVVKPMGKTIGNITPPSPTPNRDELKATETTGIQRIMNDPLLSAGQKKSRVRDLLNITRGGEDKPADGGGGILGAVKGVGKFALGGLAKATQVPVVKQAFEGLGYYNRFVQAAAQTTVQVGARYAAGPYIALNDALGFDSRIEDLKQQQKWLNENRPTFRSIGKNIANKEYSLFGTDPTNNFISTGNDKLDKTLQFGVSVYIDPLSRVGVGAKANMGYGGRAGLVADMSTTQMIAKYPVLAEAGVADKILRLGAAGIPKVVRQGEGINLGLRYAGVILPRTEKLEIGFANSFGRARAAIGDVVYNTSAKSLPVVGKVAGVVGKVTTPESLSGLRAAGGGRRGLLGIEAIQREMLEFSANRFAKGEFSTAAATANMDLIPLIKRQ